MTIMLQSPLPPVNQIYRKSLFSNPPNLSKPFRSFLWRQVVPFFTYFFCIFAPTPANSSYLAPKWCFFVVFFRVEILLSFQVRIRLTPLVSTCNGNKRVFSKPVFPCFREVGSKFMLFHAFLKCRKVSDHSPKPQGNLMLNHLSFEKQKPLKKCALFTARRPFLRL